MSERFSRAKRLLSAADYRRVFSAPDVKAGQAQLLLLARRNSLGHHRLGLAVAKKHIACAAKRNLFKRLARERFRRLRGSNLDAGLHSDINSDPSCDDACSDADNDTRTETVTFDIVVLSRPAASDADRATLGKALDAQFIRLFKRANAC